MRTIARRTCLMVESVADGGDDAEPEPVRYGSSCGAIADQ